VTTVPVKYCTPTGRLGSVDAVTSPLIANTSALAGAASSKKSKAVRMYEISGLRRYHKGDAVLVKTEHQFIGKVPHLITARPPILVTPVVSPSDGG
jgi:hypothetical protein